MGHKRQALARSELEVAQVVWKLGEARVRHVVDALAAADPEKKLDFWTVQTYLRRLKAKGYLRTRREGRADVRACPARAMAGRAGTLVLRSASFRLLL